MCPTNSRDYTQCIVHRVCMLYVCTCSIYYKFNFRHGCRSISTRCRCSSGICVPGWGHPGQRSFPDLRPLGLQRYVAYPPAWLCALLPKKAQTNKSPPWWYYIESSRLCSCQRSAAQNHSRTGWSTRNILVKGHLGGLNIILLNKCLQTEHYYKIVN